MMRLIGLLVSLLMATQAYAGNPKTYKCRSFDTGNIFSVPLVVLGGCTFQTGPAGVALITAESEALCNTSQSTRLVLGNGAGVFPGTINGSNFAGDISGGVLAIPVNRPAGWYLGQVQFTGYMSGNTLTVTAISTGAVDPDPTHTNRFVRGSGVTPANLTAQTSGPANGVGTYTFSGSAQTVGSAGAPIAMTQDGNNGMISGFGPNTATNPTGSPTTPWLVQAGQYLNGPGMAGQAAGITITGQLTSTEAGNVLGGAGTYQLSNPTLSGVSDHANGFYGLQPAPGGTVTLLPTMTSGCDGQYVTQAMTGVVSGPPNTDYWMTVEISSGGTTSNWVNSQMYILAY